MTKILMTGVTASKAEKIKSLYKNVTPIVGSHSDISLMSEACSEVDIVIAMADCDDVDAATGTLHGLKKCFDKTGSKPIFVNTSGTGVLSDKAAGMYATDIVWDDANPEQMATLQPTQPHRPVDLKIVAADTEDSPGSAADAIIVTTLAVGIQASCFIPF
ncbi:hypothetical protein C8R42DRAFT_648034 [Lentinula raphanica]|nr:hypothetical protein C8R42DRAFT_648034 [Lentinula raphanica]